jgi:ribosomal protein S18 acetylase RimI-like enzyme
MHIRPYQSSDWPQLWSFLEPVFRDGTTYALDPEIHEGEAREFWTGRGRQTFVAELDGELAGSYFLRPNQAGPGSHVCNCGYVTSHAFRGRGVASTLCEHSQAQAIRSGYLAMQYNIVVSTNEGAIRLWKRHGFDEVGRLPAAFRHPLLGYVDALVMYKWLAPL